MTSRNVMVSYGNAKHAENGSVNFTIMRQAKAKMWNVLLVSVRGRKKSELSPLWYNSSGKIIWQVEEMTYRSQVYQNFH